MRCLSGSARKVFAVKDSDGNIMPWVELLLMVMENDFVPDDGDGYDPREVNLTYRFVADSDTLRGLALDLIKYADEADATFPQPKKEDEA